MDIYSEQEGERFNVKFLNLLLVEYMAHRNVLDVIKYYQIGVIFMSSIFIKVLGSLLGVIAGVASIKLAASVFMVDSPLILITMGVFVTFFSAAAILPILGSLILLMASCHILARNLYYSLPVLIVSGSLFSSISIKGETSYTPPPKKSTIAGTAMAAGLLRRVPVDGIYMKFPSRQKMAIFGNFIISILHLFLQKLKNLLRMEVLWSRECY